MKFCRHQWEEVDTHIVMWLVCKKCGKLARWWNVYWRALKNYRSAKSRQKKFE